MEQLGSSPEGADLPELNIHQLDFVDTFEDLYGKDAEIVSPNGEYRGSATEFALKCTHIEGIDALGIFKMLALGIEAGARIEQPEPRTDENE